MKHFARFFLLGLLLSFAQSFIAQNAVPTRLSGRFKSAPGGFFLVGNKQRMDTIRLDKEGGFSIEFREPGSAFYTVRVGKQNFPCYFVSGDEAYMQWDYRQPLDSTRFGGKSAYYCVHLMRENALNNSVWNANQRMINSGDQPTFVTERDSVRKAKDAFLQETATAYQFEPSFVEVMRKAHLYQFGGELINCENVALRNGATDVQALRTAWMALPLSDEQMVRNEDYLTFVNAAVSAYAAIDYYASEAKSYPFYMSQQIEHVCNKIPSQAVRNAVAPDIMFKMIEDMGKQDLRPVVNRFAQCVSDSNMVAYARKQAMQFSYLFPGNPAPDAKCFDRDGKEYSFSSFKGKVIYVDMWATWCGPCRREIPDLKKLEEEYHGKNVQFLSVSTDRDLQAWKNFIAENQMGGLQLHQNTETPQNLSQLYLVNSIPRFIMIDKKGNIVSADAPRPSSGDEIRRMLDKTLSAN